MKITNIVPIELIFLEYQVHTLSKRKYIVRGERPYSKWNKVVY